MHRIVFRPTGREVCVPAGTRLLDAALRAGLPVAHGCDGNLLCARCGLRILRGAETLPPESRAEIEAKRSNRIDDSLRLSCYAPVCGDLEVTAPYW